MSALHVSSCSVTRGLAHPFTYLDSRGCPAIVAFFCDRAGTLISFIIVRTLSDCTWATLTQKYNSDLSSYVHQNNRRYATVRLRSTPPGRSVNLPEIQPYPE